ncbi:hypothetical protein [Streptomyces sp. DH12]|uniref:hypothetical protein n=1 Tax=Streptomyces sp. DH12 TaxID=2857010 RepID=UPI001E2B4511|nr:hypothetical protein [Streptomyces sp. DH12]
MPRRAAALSAPTVAPDPAPPAGPAAVPDRAGPAPAPAADPAGPAPVPGTAVGPLPVPCPAAEPVPVWDPAGPAPEYAADLAAVCPDLAAAYAADPLVVAQDGLATVHQLQAIGCAAYVVTARCRPGGPWRRVLPRVVLLRGTAPTPRQRLRAALLYAGPDALLTGAAALALYGARSPEAPPDVPQTVDVLVSSATHPRSHAYVRVHPTRRPEPRVPVGGLPCAPLPRARQDTLAL